MLCKVGTTEAPFAVAAPLNIFIFKGIGYGSLGVAPLAGLDTKSKNPHGIRGYIMTILKGELKRLKN